MKNCLFSYSQDIGFIVMKSLENGDEEYFSWFSDKNIFYTQFDENFNKIKLYNVEWKALNNN